MVNLLELGKPTDLLDVSAELKRHIEARGLGPPRQFDYWAERITIDHPMVKALVLPHGTRIEGDLHLDYDGLLEHRIGTVAILGDLEVTGRILNENSDGGPFFYVAGNVSARGIEKGGGSFIVLGSVTCTHPVLCDYSHGILLIGGDFSAPLIIINEQEVYVGGQIVGKVVNSEDGNMRDILVEDVFEDPEDPDCDTPDGDLIRELLAEDLPLLKSA
jgi:hypothetical protein